LKASLDEFKAEKPYEFVRYVNPETERILVTIKMTESIPNIWSLMIGDMLHNLRCALDHTMFELAGNPIGNTQVMFPIFLTEDAWNHPTRGAKPKLAGAPENVRTVIKSLQPFATGEKADSPLWHLRELSNWDKHKTIHVAMMSTRNTSNEGIAGQISSLFLGSGGPIKDETVVVGATLVHSDIPFIERAKQVHMKWNITLDITFQDTPVLDRKVVDSSLAVIGNRVRDAINVRSAAVTLFHLPTCHAKELYLVKSCESTI
jgi:hypothetical protein